MLESVSKEQLALALFYVSSRLGSIGWNFGTLTEGKSTIDTYADIMRDALEFEFEYPEYALEIVEEVLKGEVY